MDRQIRSYACLVSVYYFQSWTEVSTVDFDFENWTGERIRSPLGLKNWQIQKGNRKFE